MPRTYLYVEYSARAAGNRRTCYLLSLVKRERIGVGYAYIQTSVLVYRECLQEASICRRL